MEKKRNRGIAACENWWCGLGACNSLTQVLHFFKKKWSTCVRLEDMMAESALPYRCHCLIRRCHRPLPPAAVPFGFLRWGRRPSREGVPTINMHKHFRRAHTLVKYIYIHVNIYICTHTHTHTYAYGVIAAKRDLRMPCIKPRLPYSFTSDLTFH